MPFHGLSVARQVDFSDEVPYQFELLPAVAAGLIWRMADDLLYKLIDDGGGQFTDTHILPHNGCKAGKILWELNEEHKELLFLCAVWLFSSTRIAKIRNQSDRNIRKVRCTMLKKIRKRLLPALLDKAEKQQPMTLLEKEFLEESGMKIDSGEKKSYNE